MQDKGKMSTLAETETQLAMASASGSLEMDPQYYQKVMRVRAKKVFDWIQRETTFTNLLTAAVCLQPAEEVMQGSQRTCKVYMHLLAFNLLIPFISFPLIYNYR